MRRGTVQLVLLSCVGLACGQQQPSKPPPPPVRVAILQKHPIEQTREWLATLDGATNAEIRPRVAGYIRSVDYQEGSVVRAGTLLFTIDDRPFVAALANARGNLENALAQLTKARADVARYEPLAASHAIAREQIENAHSAARAAEANVAAQRANLRLAELNLEWTRVRSPIDGVAGIARTRVGNLVDSNQALTVVSTLDPIRASFSISEQDYLGYAQILNNANLPQYTNTRWLELVLITGAVHAYSARRVIVNREVNPQTGTLVVQALFPNPGNILRPGLFAKIRLHLAREQPTVLVPEMAVQQIQGQARVAVVNAQNRVEVRAVRIGRLIGHAYVVEDGLAPGDRVVVEGIQNVQPGMQVQVQVQPPDGGTGAKAANGERAPNGANGAAADGGI